MNVQTIDAKKKYSRANIMSSTLERMSEDSNEWEDSADDGESSDSQDEVKKGSVNGSMINEYIQQSLNQMH